MRPSARVVRQYRSVVNDRRKTLLALVDLAEGWDAVGCWDPDRAASLLRSQSSPEELRDLGVPEAVVRRIWVETEIPESR